MVIAFITLGKSAECQSFNDKPKWFLNATYYESCSCNAPCPCPFGLPMVNSYCKLNGLLEIHSGEYNKINLEGINVIISGSVGKWGEYYFSEQSTKDQKLAIESILAKVNAGGFDTILVSKKEKIDISKQNEIVAFSTTHINVKMRMVKGENDQPVIIQNLKGNLFKNYTPYFSSISSRSFPDSTNNFVFEEKAGFTSSWNLTEKQFQTKF
ncbi:MAG: DUF1326 domain-containing protein [Sediminibacterium sp.]|nr:DUF1326 domain-containing protein [Sediminibacterium sp.]